MRRSRVLNFKNIHSIIEFAVYNKFLIILMLFFLSGIIAGVISFGNSELLDNFAADNFSMFIKGRTNCTFTKTMLNSFFECMLYLVVCFIFGSSMLGTVFLPTLISVKGFLYGQTAALLYSVYSLKGIAFHTLIILPVAVIFSVILIFFARDSMRFSVLIVRNVLGNNSADISLDFKSYSVKFFIYSLSSFFCAVIDSLLSFKLIESFKL